MVRMKCKSPARKAAIEEHRLLGEYERGELHSSGRSRAELRRFQQAAGWVRWLMISSDGMPCSSTAALIAE